MLSVLPNHSNQRHEMEQQSVQQIERADFHGQNIQKQREQKTFFTVPRIILIVAVSFFLIVAGAKLYSYVTIPTAKAQLEKTHETIVTVAGKSSGSEKSVDGKASSSGDSTSKASSNGDKPKAPSKTTIRKDIIGAPVSNGDGDEEEDSQRKKQKIKKALDSDKKSNSSGQKGDTTTDDDESQEEVDQQDSGRDISPNGLLFPGRGTGEQGKGITGSIRN